MSSNFLGSGGAGNLSAQLQIRTSGKEVVAAGTVITADNKNLEFQLAHLRVVFAFVSDGATTRMEGKVSWMSQMRISRLSTAPPR